MSAGGHNLPLSGERLWASLMEMAHVGALPNGGCDRQALTDEDGEARHLLRRWCEAIGLALSVDRLGNMVFRREGCDPSRPPVAIGSHLDTQPTGGKFDGNYGVLAGLEVVRTLNDLGIATAAPIEVCIWTNEEGSRFVPVMMGSGVYAGAFTLAHALAARDRQGVSVAEALQAIGYAGSDPAAVADGAPVFGAYFEAHIEQGPVLEDSGNVIGVLTGALGQRWYDVTVTGMEAHAGPTPMNLRRDALLPATRLMQQVNAIALAHQPHGRGTVGWVEVFPNSRNTIPGRVRFTVDFRNSTDAALLAMDGALRAAAAQVVAEAGVQVQVEQVVYYPPQPFTPALVQTVRAAAQQLGLRHQDIVSGAGHDAVYVARVAPAAMIFVPCKDGISHNEIEDAREEHLTAGANVLLHAMLACAR